MSEASSTEYSAEEVALHNSRKSAWVILFGRVYDVTDYMDEHPGGEMILDVAGRDGTDEFHEIGHSNVALDILKRLQIGVLKK